MKNEDTEKKKNKHEKFTFSSSKRKNVIFTPGSEISTQSDSVLPINVMTLALLVGKDFCPYTFTLGCLYSFSSAKDHKMTYRNVFSYCEGLEREVY